MIKNDTILSNQMVASDPTLNIWVQANAGTGKTTVLVKRLLRILLQNGVKNNIQNTGILCLTYTNAAASEMQNRILEELRKLVICENEELKQILYETTGNIFTTDTLANIRKIFFTYIDTPEILKIKTFHGFCEEILKRFPLEAGISPSWTLISGATQNVLLQETFNKMINSSMTNCEQNTSIKNAFYKIINLKTEHFLNDLRKLLVDKYKDFFKIDNYIKYREYFVENTKKFLHIDTDINTNIDIKKLQNIIQLAQNLSSKNKAKYIQNIILETDKYINNIIKFDKYKSIYLTNENTPRHNILESNYNELKEEQQRVYNIQQYLLNKETFENTLALFDLSMAFADVYKQTKLNYNYLDFDDLILYTHRLFSKPDVMGWILSQLNISLHHILIDESQDTSPEQWNILKLLIDDFFIDGDKQTEDNHSIFVVGDTKQSIYSFQDADPNAFVDSKIDITKQLLNNNRNLQNIDLDINYRSLSPILKTVDYFFNTQPIMDITNFGVIQHECDRKKDQTGCVELHNILSFEDALNSKDKYILYANEIADKISSLISEHNVSPNDIMVLVQKRNNLVTPLSNVLKSRGINIAGNDRIKLPTFSIIKDLLHLIRFCLDQNNNYSLCCILKSPLFQLKEADILKLCTPENKNEPHSVFNTLKKNYLDIYVNLTDIIEHSKNMSPYSFCMYVLNKDHNKRKIISSLGKQILDPLEEFLSMCLAYERTQSGTLYHFLKWFITGDSEIKRDMDSSQGVRIMTIHGSKGLAAPIVFLIDTVYTPKTNTIIELPLSNIYKTWIWNIGNCSEILQQIIEKDKQKSLAEYYRLLYVAMTRSRDKLFIYGCGKPSNISWHSQLWNILSKVNTTQINDDIIRIDNDTQFK